MQSKSILFISFIYNLNLDLHHITVHSFNVQLNIIIPFLMKFKYEGSIFSANSPTIQIPAHFPSGVSKPFNFDNKIAEKVNDSYKSLT